MSDTLSRLPDLEQRLTQSLSAAKTRWGVYCYKRVSSTMDVARQLVRDDVAVPFFVIAEEQFQGRGRQGRPWVQTGGALYFTAVTTTDKPLEALAGFSLAVGVGVAETLESFGCDLKLKWPNDILSVLEEKCGGILIEMLPRNGTQYVLTGIGLNLTSAPAEVPGTVCVEALCGASLSPFEVVVPLTLRIEDLWQRFMLHGFSLYREAWLERAAYLGKEVSVGSDGSKVKGIVQGVNQKGELILLVGDEESVVYAGDLSVV